LASVELRGLTKRFGSLAVVDDVSLRIDHGQLVCLLGPSGCGKTTTLRLIAGFERPDSGAIKLDGVDMSRTPPHKRRVNTVFQSYALFTHKNVRENIAFGLRYQRCTKEESRRRVDEAIALVQLGGMEERRPSELSGGQQQRVALARALISRPTILFADEPTGNLDSKTSAEILDLLRSSVDSYGQTTVMVTHEPRAAAIADRVLFLADGLIVRELHNATAPQVLDVMAGLGE